MRNEKINMTIIDIIKGLKEIDDTTDIGYQVIDDTSPYVKSAQACDRLGYISNVLKSYFALLKKSHAHIESSTLHFDLSINASIRREMIHISLTPCLFDTNKDVILGLCMLTYSTRKQIGNALIKLPEVDYHLELRNDEWVQTNNPHLTNMEIVIIGHCANGKSIADIAEYLSVSASTIKTHRTSVLKKLGVNNTIEAIQYVENYNLI